jgi:hypothetical protein
MTVSSDSDEDTTEDKIMKDTENKINSLPGPQLKISRKRHVYAFYVERLKVVQKTNKKGI